MTMIPLLTACSAFISSQIYRTTFFFFLLVVHLLSWFVCVCLVFISIQQAINVVRNYPDFSTAISEMHLPWRLYQLHWFPVIHRTKHHWWRIHHIDQNHQLWFGSISRYEVFSQVRLTYSIYYPWGLDGIVKYIRCIPVSFDPRLLPWICHSWVLR